MARRHSLARRLVKHEAVRSGGMTAREKVYGFLDRLPAGASNADILALLFSGGGSDPEVGSRIVHQLLGNDPHFVYESDSERWSLKKHAVLKTPLTDAQFVVVDLETTGGRPGPGGIIEIGAYQM